jgi:glycerol transport system ATP-binding protein
VFSNPPINTSPASKRGGAITLASGVTWAASGPAANLPDGEYTIGIRPDAISPVAGSGVTLAGKVLITELSGSESSAHFAMGDQSWVSLAHGVHAYKVGEVHQFHLDPAACFYFAPDGRFVA